MNICQVKGRVSANDIGSETVARGLPEGHTAGPLNNMLVGDDQAIAVDDKARAAAKGGLNLDDTPQRVFHHVRQPEYRGGDACGCCQGCASGSTSGYD